MSFLGGIEPVAYDLKTASIAVSVSESHLRRQINAGHLQAHWSGRKYLILRRDLEAWVESLPSEAPNWWPGQHLR